MLMAKKPVRSNYASWQDQKFYEDSLAWVENPLFGWCNKNTKPDGTAKIWFFRLLSIPQYL